MKGKNIEKQAQKLFTKGVDLIKNKQFDEVIID